MGVITERDNDLSAHAWHALAALGTDGGQPCANGDLLGLGVHLLWSIRPQLGFPQGGYDVWRRRHRQPEWSCFNFEDALDPMPTSNEWRWLGYRLEASPGEIVLDEFACGKLPGLHLPGSRTLMVWAAAQSIGLRASGSGAPPLVDVFVADGDGIALAAQERARAADSNSWTLDLWVDGIVAVRFAAEDLRLCGLCFGLPVVDGGWERLNAEPILLPVVAPGSANEAANIHSPLETQAIAADRLSRTLAPPVRHRLATGFAGDLRELTESLLRDGGDATLPEQADISSSARTPPTLGLRSATLVALSAVDPDVSRMLGLYWHDTVDTAGPWDYRVVAHHGAIRYPGRTVGFADLAPGALATPTLEREGLSFVGNEGLEVVTIGGPFQARTALRFAEPRSGTVAGILIAPACPSITLHVGGGLVIFSAWRGGALVATAPSLLGEVLLEHGPGIDAVTWTAGPVDLLDVELRPETGVVGDLVAYAWTLSPLRAPRSVRALSINEAGAASEGTRLLSDGTVDSAIGVVGLDWSVESEALDVGRPLRVHVARSERGSGEAPEASGPFEIRNESEPALAFARAAGPPVEWPGPEVPHRWTERGIAPGWYAWRVRGIDAYGRLGEWTAESVLEVRPAVPPPPPDLVTARALDPDDPHLSDADRALVDADGAGLFVEWSWTAERRLRAPQVEPSGEFRVYVRRGDPNAIEGHVTAVLPRPSSTRLETDLAWKGAPGGLVGEQVRLGRASFTVLAHGSGAHTWIEVSHPSVSGPRPGLGPFTIAVPAGAPGSVDLADPLSFQVRVHVAPVGPLARVTTRVVGVVKHGLTASVTLEAPLPDAGGEPVPGRLVSRGIAFPVIAQTPGSRVVDVAAVVQPDGTAELPGVDDACTLWAGARYSAWLPGVVMEPTPREAVARGLVAVSTSDGDPAVADDPVWSQPGRGGLGGRAGREGRTSRVTRVDVPHRTPPAAVVVVRPPEQDGDIPADQAEPADWYGRARYALAFDTVTNATGYRILRASTAALFDRDRILRQTAAAPYEGGPFDDGGASAAWLAENHPTVSVADLTTDLSEHPDPLAVLAAWRGWSAWFYLRLLNKEVMDLAEIEGNQEAFRAAHEGTIPSSPFRDTLDGRGLGRFVYRVRSVDASNNAGAWSRAFPLVEVRDVTPPKTPTLVSALGAEGAVVLSWTTNEEPDLAGYRVWRAASSQELVDVRRRAPHADVGATPDVPVQRFVDEGLAGRARYAYRVAAYDRDGNVSAPTRAAIASAADTTPPTPPAWERAEWVRLDSTGTEFAYDDPAAAGFAPAIALRWLAEEILLVSTLERQSGLERTWRPVMSAVPVDASDPRSAAARRYRVYDQAATTSAVHRYRVRAADAAGNLNTEAFDVVTVEAVE